VIKYKKIKWASHVACTEEMTSTYKLEGGKSEDTNWDIGDLD